MVLIQVLLYLIFTVYSHQLLELSTSVRMYVCSYQYVRAGFGAVPQASTYDDLYVELLGPILFIVGTVQRNDVTSIVTLASLIYSRERDESPSCRSPVTKEKEYVYHS